MKQPKWTWSFSACGIGVFDGEKFLTEDIRRPVGMLPHVWERHAAAICKLLNRMENVDARPVVDAPTLSADDG